MAGASLISLLLGMSLSKDKMLQITQDLHSQKSENKALLKTSNDYKSQLTDSRAKFQDLSDDNNLLISNLSAIEAQENTIPMDRPGF